MAEIKINMDSLKSFKKIVRHKVKEGSNIFRILPPGPDSNGYPYQKWSVIWGLNDPTSGQRRPYASSSTHEGKCPVFDYLDLLKPKMEFITNELKTKGLSQDQIKESLKDLNKIIGDIRPKTAYVYNAADKSGTVGVLELKATAHKKLLTLMNNYILDYNQDPTSLGNMPEDSGVWFNVTRVGTSFDTEYDVLKNQTMVKTNGVPSYQDDRAALPDHVRNEYDSLAYDLTSIYQKKSYDELKQILILNLSLLSQKYPSLWIEEFCGPKMMTVVQPTVEQPIVKNTTAKVSLKLENPNDVDSILDKGQDKNLNPASYAGDKGQAGAITQSNDVDELLAMANNIFNQ
jgi:hypothetical protein